MLVEVNHSPSFNLDTAVDSKVKFSLVRDLFAMIYLGEDSSEELWKSDPFTQKKYNIQRFEYKISCPVIYIPSEYKYMHAFNVCCNSSPNF